MVVSSMAPTTPRPARFPFLFVIALRAIKVLVSTSLLVTPADTDDYADLIYYTCYYLRTHMTTSHAICPSTLTWGIPHHSPLGSGEGLSGACARDAVDPLAPGSLTSSGC